MRSSLLAAALITASALTASGAAHAAWSNAQSMVTEDGVEIAVDGRVFTIFSMLNALGFDDDTVRGPAPIHKPIFAAARVKVRDNLGRPGPSLAALQKVFDKHPLERDAFVAAALELGPAPNFEDKGASPLAKAIAGPMRDWYNEEGGVGIHRLVGDEARAYQKKLLPVLDKAVKATTALVRLGDKQDQLLDDSGAVGRVVVVVNDLDAHGTVQRVQHGDVTYVVAGPSRGDADDQALVTASVVAYARTLVAREAQKAAKAGTLADASKLSGKKLDDTGYATELLACAFARKVRGDVPCVGSPVAGDGAATAALKVLSPRVDAFAKDTAVLSASVEQLLAPAPPEDGADAGDEATADGKKADAKKAGDKKAGDKKAGGGKKGNKGKKG